MGTEERETTSDALECQLLTAGGDEVFQFLFLEAGEQVIDSVMSLDMGDSSVSRHR